jgi:uncharacterized protein (DUF1800 family)
MTMKRRSRPVALLALALTFVAGAPAGAGRFTGTPSQLDATEARVRAAQFLSRTTFGPSAEQIVALSQRIRAVGARAAFDEWIEAQFRVPPTFHHPIAKQMASDDGFDVLSDDIKLAAHRHYAWWHVALTAPDQLRQRMAWALSQIFVINQDAPGLTGRGIDASGQPQYLCVANYYDMLVRNAFGDYRRTLGDVSMHPVMGVFLSHVRNPKGDPAVGRFPDENFARESMQLMSIGLYVLSNEGVIQNDARGAPIPSFDGEQLKALARVWTGLGYARAPKFESTRYNLHEPMQMFEEWHDTGSKRLVSGVVLPAGQRGLEDIADALDTLAAHRNVGPFIGRLLIQRFVKSNPSRAYIAAVAASFDGAGPRGDWKRVLKAILLHPEALESLQFRRSGNTLLVEGHGTEWSRLQEPVLRYTAFLRAFDPKSTHPTRRFLIGDVNSTLNQEVYRAPTVFNFYLPSHVPAGPLQTYQASARIPDRTIRAPEFEILTSVAANRLANRLRADVRDAKVDLSVLARNERVQFQIALDFATEEALATQPKTLLEHLDVLLCQGALSVAAHGALASALTATPATATERARAAVLAVLTAPDCVVRE